MDKLSEVVKVLESMGSNHDDVEFLVIYAGRPWTPDSPAILLDIDEASDDTSVVPPKAQPIDGRYLMGGWTAADFLEGLAGQGIQDRRKRVERLIQYAEEDA